MKELSPFPFSNTNKRYHTLDYFYKSKYHAKVFKLTLQTGATCPNRDNSKSDLGCYFCSYDPSAIIEDFTSQITKQQAHFKSKYPDCKFILYLQSGSNTYLPLEKFKEMIDSLITLDIVGIIIGTRPDTISPSYIEYFQLLNKKIDVYVELGLQTIFDQTAKLFNRQYTFNQFLATLKLLNKAKIPVGVHLINGLPGESKEMMIRTVKIVSQLDIQFIKFHYLTITKNSYWGDTNYNYPLLSQEEYLDILLCQLQWIPASIVIARVTCDITADNLIAPSWGLKKINVLNSLDVLLAQKETYQGKNLIDDPHFIHKLVDELLINKSHALDATFGNGNDLLFLAKHFDRVSGLDIQELAYKRTKEKIAGTANISLFKEDFVNIAHYIKADTTAIIFNLGFLPGSDHEVTTFPKSIIAIKNAITFLPKGGRIFITVYTKHENGILEYFAIEDLLKENDSYTYDILSGVFKFYIIIEKNA